MCASKLHTIEDFSVFQSLQDIITAPLWQFSCEACLHEHKFTYLLTYAKNGTRCTPIME